MYCVCSKITSSRPSAGTWKFRIGSICFSSLWLRSIVWLQYSFIIFQFETFVFLSLQKLFSKNVLNWAYLPLQNLSYSLTILSTSVKISTNYNVFTTRLKYGGVRKWRHQFFLKFWPLLIITFENYNICHQFFPLSAHLSQGRHGTHSQVRLWACGHGDISTSSFGSHLNPISTRGADYVHPILVSTPSFERHRRTCRELRPPRLRSCLDFAK
jgi:hypothetical protein